MTPPDPLAELHRLAAVANEARAPHAFARAFGRVGAITPSGITVLGLSPWLKLGDLVALATRRTPILAEVIRLDAGEALVKPLTPQEDVALGCAVTPRGPLQFRPHASWKGRLINALAQPADGGPPLALGAEAVTLSRDAPPAMTRGVIREKVTTGVRVVDVFTPLCFGQRIGVFAGSGVGKSTLLAMLSRAAGFDMVVIALVGERGREVREFVEKVLGPASKNTILVVATGDESPMMRKLAPQLATTIAEYFRSLGQKVLLIMDSVTRYAHACRDIAMAAGEPPVARGYPPSVFSSLPGLLERAGPGPEGQGSITGIYAVLVDGDDHNDPVADTIRGTLDGHIVLSRTIGEQGRYPAVDVQASLSRLAPVAWTAEERTAATDLRRLVARFEDSRDLRALGGYQPGQDEELDRALALVPRLYAALNQPGDAPPSANAFADVAEVLKRPSLVRG